jgi:hypothetical protein
MSIQHVTHAVEFRVAGDGHTISGIAVPYEVRSDMVPDPRGEVFKRGAFKRNVANMVASGKLPKLFLGHDHRQAVGRLTALDDTDEGLLFEARLAGTPSGEAAAVEVREGTLDSVSVGFVAVRERRGAQGVREVVEARMVELSLTPLPAYEGAGVLAFRAASIPPLPPMPRIDVHAGFRLPLVR